jgi:hypothetical protein
LKENAQQAANEILSYFVRNPKAADTLEGIARWRLVDEVIHRKLQETRSALAWLVESGFILVNSSLAAGDVFTLNEAKIAEAKCFLESAETCKRVLRQGKRGE